MILKDLKDTTTVPYIELKFETFAPLFFEFVDGEYLCIEGAMNYGMFEEFGSRKVKQIKIYHAECLSIELENNLKSK